MKNIVNKLNNLKINNNKNSKFYYKKEAKNILNKINKKDPNFKYFIIEFINIAKNELDLNTIGLIISDLQKHTIKNVIIDDSNCDCEDLLNSKLYKKYNKEL